jgi:exonuclease SbcD
MKILHTADWHLGDRLNHIDRTPDLRRAVERVAGYCLERDVEVLLVAGDLFSERCRADGLRDAIEHLQRTFRPFLERGGTIAAITGNHDNETFCRTLAHAMALAAPGAGDEGMLLPNGRFYLAAGPTFFRLRDSVGQSVQFVLMPYPTDYRYLDEAAQRYNSLEEKHRALQAAYTRKLKQMRQHALFDAALPSILAAHVHVKGSALATLFRITEQEDILVQPADLPGDWAYVALGHIHQPQHLNGLPHVRYSGSIERLDMGEREDSKSVVLVDIGPDGLRGPAELLPLDATSFLKVAVGNARDELPRLRETFSAGSDALVRLRVQYRAGDDLHAILRELRRLFPRFYQVSWVDGSAASGPESVVQAVTQGTLRETVLDYLGAQLGEHRERTAVLQLAEQLLFEAEA